MSLDAGKDRSVPDVSSATYANLRRAKSLDRRVTESSMTVSACSVIAIHVCYFWNVHDVMHHRFQQIQQTILHQGLLPPKVSYHSIGVFLRTRH